MEIDFSHKGQERQEGGVGLVVGHKGQEEQERVVEVVVGHKGQEKQEMRVRATKERRDRRMTEEESKAKSDAMRQITLSHIKSSDLELEKDWKLFRKRLPGWQERHMQSLLDEYAAIIAADAKPSTKFWKLEERLKKDVRHVGVLARMSRSRMLSNLMCLLHEKAITMSDLDGFSDELRMSLDRNLQ